jgi:hypothetical protein
MVLVGMIQSSRIKAIPYGAIKEPGEDKRVISPGVFKPHMTWMILGKTGSGMLEIVGKTVVRFK